ncbi:MAG: TatD family hydrolase [Chitinophagaceae bacterium]|jgi:TatD DNase family protein|nr:TatD family hydrolase [Chitinophagaceae bacterium]
MILIDSHTHIYLKQFNDDRNAMLERARKAGVKKFFLPAIDSESTAAMLKMETDYPGECFAMMGLHPCSVNENYKAELDLVEEWLSKRTFAAVGEIGLDFYWDKTFTEQQYEAFRIQIEWALQYKLPINIHTRNAMQDTINVVKEYKGRGLKGIFHCFTGSYESAKQIMDTGFLLGIGGVVTYKNAGLAETLERIPLEHLVLETDAPYLTPVPFRGKRNECSYLQYIVGTLATVYKTTVEEIGEITSSNCLNLYNQ